MANNPRDKHQHGGQAGKAADQHHGSTAEETRALNETLKTFSEQYYKPDEKKDRRERIKFRLEIALGLGVALNILLTIGLLIAGTFQASYSGDQVTASQNQVGIMRDTEQRQLRAYVGIRSLGIENFGEPNQVLHTMRKNYGSTLASDLFVDMPHIAVVPLHDFQFSPAFCWPAPPSPIHALTLFPGQELRYDIEGQPLSPQQVEAVRNGTDSQLVYWGTVHYRDAFGESRCTRYCWSFKGPKMAENDSTYCLQHNDAY